MGFKITINYSCSRPKDKYIHLSRDAHYQSDRHVLSTTPSQAESACSYDLDATDIAWLKLLNEEQARAGATAVAEDQLEKVIEELEVYFYISSSLVIIQLISDLLETKN